jgi:endonuclease/exonuclease/phosphatase family metal-dependent hydrolase
VLSCTLLPPIFKAFLPRILSLLLLLFSALAFAGCKLAENYLDPDGPRYSGSYAAEPDAASRLPELKVVTFNIKFGEKYEKAAEELETKPELFGADLLLLQEMDDPSTEAIARRLSLNYVYYPGSVHTNGRDFGPAVLSRWPIVEDKKLILPHRNPTDGRIRIAVRATIQTPMGNVRAYSVHTEIPWLGPRARLEQAQAILDDAKSSEDPVVLGGDFNTSDPDALDETVRVYTAAGYSWVSRGVGATAGGFTLDHVFSRRFRINDAGTVTSQASDHRPQWALIELSR